MNFQISDFKRTNHFIFNKKSKNFQIKIKRPNVTRENLPPGIYTITCWICNFTCHNNYDYSNNEDKRHCCSMNTQGNCTVCPKRCRW